MVLPYIMASTNEYIIDFIIYQLSPSLVFNLLIFILIKPFVEKLFCIFQLIDLNRTVILA